MIGQTVAEFGGFDILISNAAVNPDSGRIMKVGRRYLNHNSFVSYRRLKLIFFKFEYRLVYRGCLGQDFRCQCQIVVFSGQRGCSTHGKTRPRIDHFRFFYRRIRSQLRGNLTFEMFDYRSNEQFELMFLD